MLIWFALCLILLTGCTGGYQINSYALSRNDEVKERPVMERIPYR